MLVHSLPKATIPFPFAWEQRKVGELIEDYTERTVIQNQYPVLTSSQQQGIIFQEDYFAPAQFQTAAQGSGSSVE